MSSVLDLSKKGEGLRVLDPDLPLLASEAAIDLDNLLSNRSEDLTAIQRIAEKLKNSIKLGTTGDPHSLMDPATLTVLGEALAQTMESSPSRMVEELLSEAMKIATRLSSFHLPENSKEIEHARDFCVALSSAAMAYSKSIRDLRPSHPFRK